jgi:RNA polymerase sigma-70 factor (ECF subfamily)
VSGDAARQAVEAVFREEHGPLLAALIARTGGAFEPAEEALAEAFAAALERWSSEPLPERPAAWIRRVAERRLTDALRRRRRHGDALAELERNAREVPLEKGEDGEDDDEADHPVEDHRLRLIFTCCHRRWATTRAWR